jgi:hypothetical protein
MIFQNQHTCNTVVRQGDRVWATLYLIIHEHGPVWNTNYERPRHEIFINIIKYIWEKTHYQAVSHMVFYFGKKNTNQRLCDTVIRTI